MQQPARQRRAEERLQQLHRPTAAMPPCAEPRYQKINPIHMLNTET